MKASPRPLACKAIVQIEERVLLLWLFIVEIVLANRTTWSCSIGLKTWLTHKRRQFSAGRTIDLL